MAILRAYEILGFNWCDAADGAGHRYRHGAYGARQGFRPVRFRIGRIRLALQLFLPAAEDKPPLNRLHFQGFPDGKPFLLSGHEEKYILRIRLGAVLAGNDNEHCGGLAGVPWFRPRSCGGQVPSVEMERHGECEVEAGTARERLVFASTFPRPALPDLGHPE